MYSQWTLSNLAQQRFKKKFPATNYFKDNMICTFWFKLIYDFYEQVFILFFCISVS